MSTLIKILQQFCEKLISPDVPVDKKYRTLKALREMEVSVEDIRITNLGKIVKKCTKLEGKPGILAENIIKEWKEMLYKTIHVNDVKKKNNDNEHSQNDKNIKSTKTQFVNNSKIPNKQSVLEPTSDSQSEDCNERDNRSKNYQTKSVMVENHKQKPKSNYNKSNDSSTNSSTDENYNSKLSNNNRRSISSSEEENPIPLNHSKNNKLSKEIEIRKISKTRVTNSSDDDSSDCEEFIEMLSKNKKKLNKNNLNKPTKYSSNEESSDNECESNKSKIPNKSIKEIQSKSDSSSDSDMDYINYLESAQEQINSKKPNNPKPSNAPLGFLVPINENKNQKRVIKSELNNGNVKKEFKDEKPVYCDQKKPSISKTTFNNNIKPEINKHKSRKSEMKSGTSFEDFIIGSAMNKPVEINSRKRKSETVSVQIENKKKNLTNFIPADLTNCPALNSSLSNSDMDEQSVYNRTDIIFQKKDSHINVVKEDVDCTTKYSSERKIWTPKSRNDGMKPEVEENLRTINGVLETEIAQFSYEKLLAFDADSRKIQRKTEIFWEKLFKKNHKCANRRDGETWREAYLRNQRDQDIRLKQISERLKKTTEESANAVTKAKLLINSNLAKPKRRMTDMRR